MILAIDTSTAACTVALIAPGGKAIARADELIGRGHDRRLAPMIAELLGGHIPTHILVGIGPGSFTGIRVGLACAQGLAIGWSVPVAGMSSLALIAAGVADEGPLAVAVNGGHGELFVQAFDVARRPASEVVSLTPKAAASRFAEPLVVGGGAAALVDARGYGEARDGLPSATDALRLPKTLRSLEPKPFYARAPDAKPLEAA